MDLTREHAQQHTQQIHTFHSELAELEQQQVLNLTDEQRRQLTQHHTALLNQYREQFNIDATPKAQQLSLGMRIASLFGALTLAASVWFLFYQFWHELSPLAQMGIVISAALASLGFTLWLKPRDQDGYFSQIAAVLAFACLLLNTYVIADIHNLERGMHVYVLWGAYALALAHFTRSRLLLLTGLALVGAYLSFVLASLSGLVWHQSFEYPELLLAPALLIFCLPQLLPTLTPAYYAHVYRVLGAMTGLTVLTLLSFLGTASFLPFADTVKEGIYIGIALATCCLLIGLGIKHQWGVIRLIGTGFFILILLTKACDLFWARVPSSVFFLILSLLAIGVLVALKKLRKHQAVVSL